MNHGKQNQFKSLLKERLDELSKLSSDSAQARKPVELDQQSIGRLSRQDALQQQAMANAQEVRRKNEMTKIKNALQRLSDGEYGWCVSCGEEIAVKRLEIDPTATFCAECAV